MNDDTWARIDASFDRWPESKASPVDSFEFDQVMGVYGHVDPDYRQFVLRYGGAIVGPNPIYGLRKAELMGNVGGQGTAPGLTRWFREKR